MTRLSPVRPDIGVADAAAVVRRLVAVERLPLGTVFGDITVRTAFSTANPFVQFQKGLKVTHVSQWCSLLVILRLFLLFVDGRGSLLGSRLLSDLGIILSQVSRVNFLLMLSRRHRHHGEENCHEQTHCDYFF